MKTLQYNSKNIPIKTTQSKNFLISNQNLANTCYIYEFLLDQTRTLNNQCLLLKDKHYVFIDDICYWTKEGIIRVCILLNNDESIEFANFLESLKEEIK